MHTFCNSKCYHTTTNAWEALIHLTYGPTIFGSKKWYMRMICFIDNVPSILHIADCYFLVIVAFQIFLLFVSIVHFIFSQIQHNH